MSIIIRLQNLPLCAKSGDVRNFFGGLRIPDGGVHILGGEKGDAFIAFLSDEDARLAMRKDGGKIKDSRVKLFLSSRMEMQHEVEKITKGSSTGTPSYKAGRSSEVDANRRRSSERKRRSYSRSPPKYGSWSSDKFRSNEEYRQRSRSPIGDKRHSSRGSPRRRSRSPKRYSSISRSSSKSRIFTQRKKSASPKANNYVLPAYEMGCNSMWKNSEHSNSEHQSFAQSQLQAELEKRITEELEKNHVYKMIMGDKKPPECNIPGLNIGECLESFQYNYSTKNPQQEFMSFLSSDNNIHQFQDNEFKVGLPLNKGQQENFSFGYSETLRSNFDEGRQKNIFFVTLSGLDPFWNFREVQMMLKGIFAPQNHIRFERDQAGYKTGVAFVKLTNKDDFDSMLRKKIFVFNDREIQVNECSNSLGNNYFPFEFMIENVSQNHDFCYTLKGLPFSCTYNDVVNFFHGFEMDDIVIIYGPDGRATGTGYISFTNKQDFEAAMSQNGKKIFHRYIEMLPCDTKELYEAKKMHTSTSSFKPYSKMISEKKLPASRRPLCALLTGLPFNTTIKKISMFFSESGLKPSAIHLTLKKKKLIDGRAFVEFTNFIDFDLALKFHGKQFDNNIICVKQILYDEMVKILDSQQAKHYFETPAPVAPSSSVPEKVPYLWEPPDAIEEQNKVHAENTSRSYKDNPSHAYESGRLQDRLGNFPKGPESNIISNRHFDLHDATKNFPMIPNSPSVREAEQISIKKNFDISSKGSEPFNPLKKYEDNIKLSRLSPENEAALLEFINRKVHPSGVTDRRSKSPDRREKKPYRKKSPDGTSEYKDDKLYKSRASFDKRSRNERESKYYDEWNHDRRSPLQSSRKQNEDRSRGCIVQLSNVSVSARTEDLLHFFRGFDFYEDTLIRGYTNDGEPTRDVRVTFFNGREAERAMRMLNNRYLQNRPISMFIP